ncbi:GAF domain-containing sensor histidine kinase [archaeon]|nr:GAF domain-containing sensor histidine kinase [archaeon]
MNRFGAEIDKLNSVEKIAVYSMDTILNILKHSTGSFGIVQDEHIRFIELMGSTTTPLIPLTQKSITTRAVKTCKTQLVPDTRLDPDYLNGRVKGEVTRSELDVPIVVDNECVAVINLEHSQLNHFTSSDANLIEIMAEHIAANIVRINQQKKILETERKAIREQERAEQAIKIEEMKTRFIQTATHEIRTPLTSIKGYTQLAQTKLQDVIIPDLNRYFDAILRNTERLESLSADLLDVQRIESGRLELNKAPTYINDILNDLQLELKPILDSRNQELIVSGDNYLLNVDRIRLMQVLTNLVMNASKFSPEGSEIKVKVKQRDDMVTISVIDEGVGIREEDIPKLFKPFPGIRVKGVKDSTGLGLSISKGLVELHGGEIWAESEGLGKGSRFTFSCPCMIDE